MVVSDRYLYTWFSCFKPSLKINQSRAYQTTHVCAHNVYKEIQRHINLQMDLNLEKESDNLCAKRIDNQN